MPGTMLTVMKEQPVKTLIAQNWILLKIHIKKDHEKIMMKAGCTNSVPGDKYQDIF